MDSGNCCAGSLVSPTEALARGVTLSQEEISRYTEKLQNAKQFQTRLSNRVVCIQGVHDNLLSQKHAFELQLGDFRKAQNTFIGLLEQKKSLYNGYDEGYKSKVDDYKRLEIERQGYQQQKLAQEYKVAECKEERIYVLGWTCDADDFLEKFFGLIESVDEKLKNKENDVEWAKQNMQDARQQLENAQRELATVNGKLGKVEDSITNAETDISKLAKTLSDLRKDDLAYSKLVLDFTHTLNDAGSVNASDADKSSRIAREINDFSTQIDQAISRATNSANMSLPDEFRQQCSY